MAEPAHRPHRLKVAIPIRIRGMSTENKFFDEATETLRVGSNLVITRIQSLVELESEVHVTNLTNQVGGTFRVLWVNTQGQEGWHDLGLEFIQAEGKLWAFHFPAGEEAQELAAQTWLRCQRCQQAFQVALPEAEEEFLYDGFVIARACAPCKATTPWAYVEQEAAAESEEPAFKSPRGGRHAMERSGREKRIKGRAPLNMHILVTRKKYGTQFQDVSTTVNISRHGICFLSSQSYDVGEEVKVVMPYKEGELGIPVRGHVVRQEQTPDGASNAVAIELEPRKAQPRGTPPGARERRD